MTLRRSKQATALIPLMSPWQISLLPIAAILLLLSQHSHAQSQGTAAALHRGGGGEVVVTARKRVESLVDTPIAITALNGDAMEARGMTQLSDYRPARPVSLL